MISIIIPVLNEAETVPVLLRYLCASFSKGTISEIILIDGGSEDGTRQLVKDFAESTDVTIRLISSEKGRARQMNAGAKLASGSIFYFLHADSLPPENFDACILEAVSKGKQAGCFRMKFNSDHLLLKLSGWFTRFNIKLFRGGDQSLFITRKLFDQLQGFDEDYIVYEDCEFINRIYARSGFTIIPETIVTSSRRYAEIGTWRLQYHFGMIHLKNYCGAGASGLFQYYSKHIRQASKK